jgi:hypothetical protein
MGLKNQFNPFWLTYGGNGDMKLIGVSCLLTEKGHDAELRFLACSVIMNPG